MKYQILETFKARISGMEATLKAGQIITLSDEKAVRLIQAGRVRAVETFCYWLDSTVPDCQMPCFKAAAGTFKKHGDVIHECSHFQAYWQAVLDGYITTKE